MKQRIITAIVAGAVFVPTVLIGGIPFTLMMYAIATIALYEMLRMKQIKITSGSGVLSVLALFVFLLPNEWALKFTELTSYTKLDVGIIYVLLLLSYVVIMKNKFTFEEAAYSFMGNIYVALGFYYFIETRLIGLEFIVFALIVIWTTDTGAYFTGRKLGKNKLWPEISPNKTVEGFIGGIVLAVLFVMIFQYFYPIANSWTYLIVVTIVASIIGQLGDLVESAIKRHFDVKDSGTILPGHGGMLDRFDSLLFVLPVLHLLHFVS